MLVFAALSFSVGLMIIHWWNPNRLYGRDFQQLTEALLHKNTGGIVWVTGIQKLRSSLQLCHRLAWHCRTARIVLNCLLGQKSRRHCLSHWGSGCCLLTKLISFSSLLQEVQVCAVSFSCVLFWRINDNPLIRLVEREGLCGVDFQQLAHALLQKYRLPYLNQLRSLRWPCHWLSKGARKAGWPRLLSLDKANSSTAWIIPFSIFPHELDNFIHNEFRVIRGW